MFLLVVVLVLVFFIAISWLLWKSGFLYQAEKPISMLEVQISDERARKAFLKRLQRWRDEGKVSREEYEHVLYLCEQQWE